MKRIMLLVICLSVLAIPATALAVNIGKVTKNEIDRNYYIPATEWVGEKFIFLEKYTSTQSNGYQLFGYTKEARGIPYSSWVGKTITLESFDKRGPLSYPVFKGEGKTLYYDLPVTFDSDTIDNIILVRDLENAKKRWIGKTIFSRSCLHTYSNESGKDEFGTLSNSIVIPLYVTDVIPAMVGGGTVGDNLWIIVKNPKGEIGYIGARYSWTNRYRSYEKDFYPFSGKLPWENEIFEINPIKKYNLKNDEITMINEGTIRIGVRKVVVELSWGYPESINKGHYRSGSTEQWVYSTGSYVYFDNVNRVTAIQN